MKDLKRIDAPEYLGFETPIHRHVTNIMERRHLFFWMPMRTRTIHLITVILILCSGN